MAGGLSPTTLHAVFASICFSPFSPREIEAGLAHKLPWMARGPAPLPSFFTTE